ncbi:MAG: Sec-independent protein translocase subunit TatA [Actinobacteria bacterium]|uniref:Sec-independent protein translocase protein TatA n=1 Tax=Nostocoides veronense TaxID=330836 RepID=A0ABN2LGK2_9MICO|nr:Sec-independent protein translocase subunit TatA [Actinomycetota bacterium]
MPLGAPELVIIAVVIILLFGWKRLPDAARSLGRSARVFKAEVNEMKVEDQARKRDGSTDGTSAIREDNSPRTDNQSGPTA